MIEDPNPFLPGSLSDERDTRNEIIIAFEDKMYDIFSYEECTGKEPWADFISTGRPHSIRTWPISGTCKWCRLLQVSCVHIDRSRDISRAEALKNILVRKEHLLTAAITAEERIEAGPLHRLAPNESFSV